MAFQPAVTRWPLAGGFESLHIHQYKCPAEYVLQQATLRAGPVGPALAKILHYKGTKFAYFQTPKAKLTKRYLCPQ